MGEIFHLGYLPTTRINTRTNQTNPDNNISHPLTRILTATPTKEEDRARIKWPKPPAYKYPKNFRGRGPRSIPLRDRIYVQVAQETGLNLKKCSVCGVETKHGNFDVHHINGDHNDNRPENLTVLCQFCHINAEHGYPPTEFPSDSDGVFVEETNGIIQEE